MTTPSDPDNERPSEGVDLGKSSEGVDLGKSGVPTSDAPFDPYRFGQPDHPIPAEYAPPGYTGPTIPAGGANPYAAPNPWAAQPPAQPPYGAPNPFNNPPGTPYPQQHQQQPYQYPPPSPVYGQSAPPPPPYHSYVQPKTGNGKAVTGLVLGILSIVMCWLFFFDAVFVVLGLIFSLIALGESKRRPGGQGRGMAIAGLVCTIVGALAATVLTVLLVHAVNKCGGFSQSDRTDFNHCVTNHF